MTNENQNIDWSKAPADATHWGSPIQEFSGGFAKETKVGFMFWNTDHWSPVGYFNLVYLSKLVERPAAEQQRRTDTHYNNTLRLKVTQADADVGYIDLKLDPYLVQRTCNITDPVLQHIHKKAQRGTSKGHSMMELLTEISQSAERGIELERLV